MRRSTRLTALLLLAAPSALWLAACSSDRSTALTGNDPAASAHRSPQMNAGQCAVPTQQQIVNLFNPTFRGQPTSGLSKVTNDLSANNTTAAINDMFAVWDYTVRTYYAGKLTGGLSTQTQTNALAFGQALYCLVGLDGSQLALTTTPLDADDIVQVVYPADTTQTVITGSKHAGVSIPGGTLTQPVTISVSILPGPYTFPAGPLNTKLDQYGQFFEFKVVPEQTFNTPVVAAACLQAPNGGPPPGSVDMAHNVGTGIEILPTHAVSFLVCGPTALAPQPSAFQLARMGEYGRALKSLGTSMLHAFSPTPAYALVSSGFGGTTKSFSPFGGVDTAVVAQLPASFPSQPQTAAEGSNVAAAPAVMVQTTNGHTPLGGASVTFNVASGGGSVGPITSSTRTTTTTITSDATGLAAVPNWTLGVGPTNSVTASASFALPATISGFPTTAAGPGAAIVVSGNPFTFTANSTDVIPYEGTDYTYLSGADGIAPGFEQPSYAATAQNGWSTGAAAFASSNLGASCSSLTASVGTIWPNNPSGTTDMLLRKTYTLPGWWTIGLSVGIAIDNDFQAFVDGVNVTPTNATGYDPSSGYVIHDGCASRDSYVFPVPSQGGTHLLAIRARDRGTAAYVDTRVTVTP